MKKLSIVVPAYNEAPCIVPFVNAVVTLGLENPYEIVFVDDGSCDDTLQTIKRLSVEDEHIRYVSFSRNFGKESALRAGLEHARGDLVVTMDADLQHDPKLLPEMIRAVEEEGYDSAAACRTTRTGEPKVRSWFAHRFYQFVNKMSEVAVRDGAMDYRLMTRPVLDGVLRMKENARFTRGLYAWVGFRTKWLESPNLPRQAGETKWSFLSLFVYSVKAVISYSAAPLHLSFLVSTLTFIASMVLFALGCPTAGLITLLHAVEFAVLGVIGLYVAEIFRETKNRPMYIVREAS